jgi:hypothetical protein
MTTYRVRDWAIHYEKNHKDTEVIYRWVAVPTKHDGKGIRRIAGHKDAVAVFCAWNLILQVAAKMPTRGLLADESGPLDADDLADATGFPADIFRTAFKVLCDQKIGWLEQVDSPDKSGLVPDKFRLQDSTGQNKTTQNKGRATHASTEPAAKPANSVPPSGSDCAPVADSGTRGRVNGREPAVKPSDCSFPVFPCSAGKRTDARQWRLADTLVSEWAEAFPAVDVRIECRKAHAWVKANLGRRKTAGGMPAFLCRWLGKAQDAAGSSRARGNGSAKPTRDEFEDARVARLLT